MAEEKKVVDAPVEEAKEEELTFRKPTDRDYEVLRYMIVTEKSQKLAATNNVITLRVTNDTNKTEIRSAVQAVFQVKVKKVNTVTMPIKKLSARRGYHQPFKKAYVYVDRAFDLGKIANQVAAEDRK